MVPCWETGGSVCVWGGCVSALHRHPIRGRPLLPLTLISIKPFLWNRAPEGFHRSPPAPPPRHPPPPPPHRSPGGAKPPRGTSCLRDYKMELVWENVNTPAVRARSTSGLLETPASGSGERSERRERRERGLFIIQPCIIWLFPIDWAQKCFPNVMSLFAGLQG